LRDYYQTYDRPKDPRSIKAMKIGIASPERILEWSHGEVTKPETINYRTFKPEKDGLFCARIFGPVKDYECLCGKYKRMKHRGITCEKCGVEVISSKVRRERMGHITLATPVAHIWFLKSLPSRIATVLDMGMKELESVLYCVNYVVVDPGKVTTIVKGQVISEDDYDRLQDEHGADGFKAEMGAEAVRKLLEEIDVDELATDLRRQMKENEGKAASKRIAKRLKVIEAFRTSGNRPEWMILKNVPVLPPDLRPLVPLEGGRFATSDLNDLYRRVINRNGRLKRLLELNAPEIIIRNEKRMLQEAVDALFDNGRRGNVVTGPNKRPLKSLSDMLKGKQGRFRQNLLGKRVDYSGRSVIVVGPNLKLHQCGLPKVMAVELFKPFIYHELQKRGFTTTIKGAKKMVEVGAPEVWDILEDVTREHPVMLNRAPTLHRLGIQAFEPILIEGRAIQIHPLVCVAYNADFDGDQMAVHVPLSLEAQLEARVLVMSSNNILSPAYGKPIILPTQDIVLGLYYLTRERKFARGHGKSFANPEEVRAAYDHGMVDLQADIKVKIHGKVYTTTVGRTLLTEIVPEELPFALYNKTLKKNDLGMLIDEAYRNTGSKKTILLADQLRTWGFTFATRAGISVSVKDMVIPENKESLIEEARGKIREIEKKALYEGAMTESETHNEIVDIWSKTTDKISEEMMKNLSTEAVTGPDGKQASQPSFNSIFIMSDSGARGSKQQMRQLAGMRGLMAKPSGEIIPTPITSNFREGLTALQYFISTHGARKGLADTALKTANSGYLTRRLVDVAQDTIVQEYDCGTLEGVEVGPLMESGQVLAPLGERVLGRVAAEDVVDAYTGEVVVRANEQIDERKVEAINQANIDNILIRSVLTCRTEHGVCSLCYGRDLARGRLVNIGEPIGIIAAQSIGEPGTQLTMRTFHIGGTAGGVSETSTLEAKSGGVVKFERMKTVEKSIGTLITMNRNGTITILDDTGREKEKFPINVLGAELLVKEGDRVKAGQTLARWDPFTSPILTEFSGKIDFEDIEPGITVVEKHDETTGFTTKVVIEPKDPEMVPRVLVRDEGGKQLASYQLPVNAYIMHSKDMLVEAGDVIAKKPKETVKTKDITGGLPRVAELFEARRPKEFAVISEIDGVVSIPPKSVKGRKRIVVTPEVGEKREYVIPKGKYVSVQEGDFVRAGEPLMEGSANPHDILTVLGEKALALYLVSEVQKVYLRQGVRINDKHIEIIIRQMLRWVRVTDVGDTNFFLEQQVTRFDVEKENARVLDLAAAEGRKGAKGAVYEPILLGITKSALSTESFISASSFQETTRVLTEASIQGKVDYLRGLKENVIIGRLIPAGTGYPGLESIQVQLAEAEAAEEGAGSEA
jgi:DNA-directed RNA polymerase subunit beta'